MNLSNLLEKELVRWNDIICTRTHDPRAYIHRGMVHFKLANIDESIADFDIAEQLDSRLTPYLWQRGLSYYYAEKFADGAKQFEVDLSVNSQDVEETIWRYLCIARLYGAAKARQSLLPVKNDPRLVMQRVYDLYAGHCSTDDVLAVGTNNDKRAKFYGYLYIGLYFEAENRTDQARHYMTQAFNEYEIDDYMWHVAAIHQKLRGWD
jgi:tetratricopeptide (TPR) repeat protein